VQRGPHLGSRLSAGDTLSPAGTGRSRVENYLHVPRILNLSIFRVGGDPLGAYSLKGRYEQLQKPCKGNLATLNRPNLYGQPVRGMMGRRYWRLTLQAIQTTRVFIVSGTLMRGERPQGAGRGIATTDAQTQCVSQHFDSPRGSR
jgi:hypothetical protein